MRRKIKILEQIYYLLSSSLIMAYQKAQSTPFTNALINALMMEGPETLKILLLESQNVKEVTGYDNPRINI